MEVLFGVPIDISRSNSTITDSKEILSDPSDAEMKKTESKKRGVYVEKWANPKQIGIEDNKRQPRLKPKPKPLPMSEKLLTTAPAESTIATFTRLLGTPDPAVRFKKRKTPKTITTLKISKQSSKITNIIATRQPKPEVKPLRNIVEENKNVKKFRSHTLREVYSKMSEKTIAYKSRRAIVQTPSDCSKVTRDLSDHAHWSNIFPKDGQNAGNNLLQQYICNYEQGGNTLTKKLSTDKKVTQGNGKPEPMYDFFIDLLESVYDEELLNDDEDANYASPKTSEVKFEIDDKVAQKLYTLQSSSNRYTIRDETHDVANQNQQLADYHNSRKRLMPQKRFRRRKTVKSFPYLPPSGKREERRKKPRKPNLLSILKEQLSIDYTQDEPGNMYEALLTIAKQNKKRKQIYIDASSREPSEPDQVCRFKRRNVISPSTRMPNKILPTKGYSVNVTRGKYRSDMTNDERDSSHSIEVVGYDYDEGLNLETVSDFDTGLGHPRHIPNLNKGITTVTQYWKD